jgi:hypothetical protein
MALAAKAAAESALAPSTRSVAVMTPPMSALEFAVTAG